MLFLSSLLYSRRYHRCLSFSPHLQLPLPLLPLMLLLPRPLLLP
jgi:hypothetical protein